MDWRRFVCFAVMLTSTIQIATGIQPLGRAQKNVWNAIMKRITKDAVFHPQMASMFEIVYDEAQTDEIAVSTRLMDHVKRFLHLISTPANRRQIQKLNNIEEAKAYLIQNWHEGPTSSYYNNVVLAVFQFNNDHLPPILRVGLFVACYAYSKLLHTRSEFMPGDHIDSTINAVMNSMQNHLSHGRDGYPAFLVEVDAFVRDPYQSLKEIPEKPIGTSIEPWTPTEEQMRTDMMVLATNTKHQPGFEIMARILLMEAINDKTAVVSRSLDRLIHILHHLLPELHTLQTLSGIGEARGLLKGKMEKLNYDSGTISYYINGVLKLLNTNNDTMTAIHRVMTFLACYIHSKIHHTPGYDMELVITIAEELVSEHLTEEPKDFDGLVIVVSETLKKLVPPDVTEEPSRILPMHTIFKPKYQKHSKAKAPNLRILALLNAMPENSNKDDLKAALKSVY